MSSEEADPCGKYLKDSSTHSTKRGHDMYEENNDAHQEFLDAQETYMGAGSHQPQLKQLRTDENLALKVYRPQLIATPQKFINGTGTPNNHQLATDPISQQGSVLASFHRLLVDEKKYPPPTTVDSLPHDGALTVLPNTDQEGSLLPSFPHPLADATLYLLQITVDSLPHDEALIVSPHTEKQRNNSAHGFQRGRAPQRVTNFKDLMPQPSSGLTLKNCHQLPTINKPVKNILINNSSGYVTSNYHYPTSNLPPEFRLEPLPSGLQVSPQFQHSNHQDTMPLGTGTGVVPSSKPSQPSWQKESQIQGLRCQVAGPSSDNSSGGPSQQIQLPSIPTHEVIGTHGKGSMPLYPLNVNLRLSNTYSQKEIQESLSQVAGPSSVNSSGGPSQQIQFPGIPTHQVDSLPHDGALAVLPHTEQEGLLLPSFPHPLADATQYPPTVDSVPHDGALNVSPHTKKQRNNSAYGFQRGRAPQRVTNFKDLMPQPSSGLTLKNCPQLPTISKPVQNILNNTSSGYVTSNYHYPTSNLPPEFRLEPLLSRLQVSPQFQHSNHQDAMPLGTGTGVVPSSKPSQPSWQKESQIQGLLRQVAGPSSDNSSEGPSHQIQLPGIPTHEGMGTRRKGSMPLYLPNVNLRPSNTHSQKEIQGSLSQVAAGPSSANSSGGPSQQIQIPSLQIHERMETHRKGSMPSNTYSQKEIQESLSQVAGPSNINSTECPPQQIQFPSIPTHQGMGPHRKGSIALSPLKVNLRPSNTYSQKEIQESLSQVAGPSSAYSSGGPTQQIQIPSIPTHEEMGTHMQGSMLLYPLNVNLRPSNSYSQKEIKGSLSQVAGPSSANSSEGPFQQIQFPSIPTHQAEFNVNLRLSNAYSQGSRVPDRSQLVAAKSPSRNSKMKGICQDDIIPSLRMKWFSQHQANQGQNNSHYRGFVQGQGSQCHNNSHAGAFFQGQGRQGINNSHISVLVQGQGSQGINNSHISVLVQGQGSQGQNNSHIGALFQEQGSQGQNNSHIGALVQDEGSQDQHNSHIGALFQGQGSQGQNNSDIDAFSQGQGNQGQINSHIGAFSQGQGSQGQIDSPFAAFSQGQNYLHPSSSMPSFRYIQNSLYDPRYEVIGLCVDPYLRIYALERKDKDGYNGKQ